jgi:Ni/Fe-hydrogenase subunit HybB-like protein
MVSALGFICGSTAVTVIYYIGPFSAGSMVLTLAIYFFGTSHSRTAARITYATIAVLYMVTSAGIASGLFVDRALHDG